MRISTLLFILIWGAFIEVMGQQIQFNSISLINSRNTFSDNYISFKQFEDRTIFLSYENNFSGRLELTSIESNQAPKTKLVWLDNDLKFNNALGEDLIIDFSIKDSLFFILTQKRVLGYITDKDFTFFEKCCESKIEQIFPSGELHIKASFNKINFGDDGNLILSRYFMRSLGDVKVCLVKLSHKVKDKKGDSFKLLEYYFSEKTSYTNDAMSLSSRVIHLAQSTKGIHAIVKNGFLPKITFIGKNLKEFKTVYLNLYDTAKNYEAVERASQASQRYISKSNSANLSKLMEALNSCFYLHSISFLNETTLFVQIQNPSLPILYQSFLVGLDSLYNLKSILEVHEFDINKNPSDTITTTNFPIWFSNLNYFVQNNRVYVLKMNCAPIYLNRSLVKEFFLRKSLSEDKFHYIIEYEYK